MKRMHAFLALLAFLLVGFSASLRAEDTDIYVDNSGTTGTPNLLFVIDNGADFSSSAPACSYGTGGTASLSGTTGGVEQCALVDAINSLPLTPDGKAMVNIGVMVGNDNGFATDARLTGDAAYHELCTGTYGGCLLRKFTPMDAAGKANLINFIKTWKTAGQNSATEFNVKGANNGRTAQSMQEAWAYLNGKTGMSGKTYGTDWLTAGCQRNFVVFIANAYGPNGTPGDGGTLSPGPDGAMGDAQVGASAAQKAKISETVSFVPNTCGVPSIVAGNQASDWSNNWADEWARLMFQQDGGTSDMQGMQNIITYTIGVVNDAQCKPDYPALLTTMARYGGGKYFKTSNSSDLATAIGQILNEVQAVNSVFSSASLPVSVNAQGTYLNQIFLGMFRPDPDGLPRWMGNLKQYKLIEGSGGNLVMGDAKGNAAISSAGTGFLSPTAVSIWTSKIDTQAPDDAATGGFFFKDPKGTPAGAFDSADGEVVEKGGVAQQLRKESLKSTFAGPKGTGNPRRLYTYCPSGSGCNADLTDASNEFSTANSGIADDAFGTSTGVAIASIQRTGTTAVVTTVGNHGFKPGYTVTIDNVDQGDYNVTQTLTSTTLTGSKTFTITGLSDRPRTPALGTYIVGKPGASAFGVSTISRNACGTAGCATNSDTVTVTTATPHTFVSGNTVTFNSVPAGYASSAVVTGASGNTFTYSLNLSPTVSSVAGTASYASNGSVVISSLSAATPSAGSVTATTNGHSFHVGQVVTITGSKSIDNSYAITAVNAGKTTFTFASSATDMSPAKKNASITATRPVTGQPVTLQRTTNAVAATVQVTGAGANVFANGDTVKIAAPGGIAPASGSATISCTGNCSTFTYTIPLPATPVSPTATSVSTGGGVFTASAVSRNTSGTVTMVMPTNTLRSGDTVTIAPANGIGYTDESEYVGSGSFTITCNPDPGCTTLTYGPIALDPLSPATGTNMQVTSPSASPDRDSVIKWVRGMDNQGDEKGPGSGVTVRGSIHGDVLHSRPLVINYGDSRGIVAFYGANDGVFRAANGNACTATASTPCPASTHINGVPPGGEIWGLVLAEHFPYLNRLRTNSPELRFPSTFLASARPKDYFIDGPTGVYQRLAANGTISQAYIYLTMRRGGRMIYALDVTQPAQPRVLWQKDNSEPGYEELGQTWSRPRLTLLQNYPNPVLIFGGGYGPNQDTEPPQMSNMGRAIYIVDATNGDIVWRAQQSCGPTGTCKSAADMKFPVPSDITFIDRDNNGKIDKLYFGDLGGNVWRVDVADATPSNWAAPKRIAALGCDDGNQPSPVCSNGKAPRKFFFPPSVLSIKAAGATGSYDAISMASGDREHPLKNTAPASAYSTVDRFFLVKDTATAIGTPPTTTLTQGDLFNATSTAWDGTGNGIYITFATGEKAVNAALAVNGTVFFATNKPIDSTAQCAANLGQARAYGVNPFDGTFVTNVLQGGGMPPSAVAGVVQLTKDNGNGGTTTYNEKFCIGCGISGSQLGGTNTNPCNSALENCNVGKVIPKNLRRTYWYKK